MQDNAISIEQVKRDVFLKIWELVDNHYPIFDERKVNWLDVRQKFSDRIEGVSSFSHLYKVIDEMLLELKDPHTRVLSSPSIKLSTYPMSIISIGDDYYIGHVFDQDSKLEAGMKILAVNGICIGAFKNRIYSKFDFKSRSMQKASFINELLTGDFGGALEITAAGERQVSDALYRKDITTITGCAAQSGNIPGDAFRLCIAQELPNDIGYIKILSFRHKKVLQDFKDALALCRKNTSLIIDIRGNQGGLIEETMNIASAFVTEQKLIGYKVNRKKQGSHYELNVPLEIRVKPDGGMRNDFKNIVVLCDEFTMSSSEFIFLKALKSENTNIRIVGSQTAGLAHEATVYTLFDGTRLQVTTYKYLTPEGTTMDEVGVLPDIVINNTVSLITRGEDMQLNYGIDLCKS